MVGLIRRAGALLFVLGLALGCALAQGNQGGTLERVLERGTLRVGVNPEFKPFSFTESGERVGVDIDIAAQLAQGLGADLELVTPESFSDLLPMLQGGDIDVAIAGMSITFERAKEVDFSDPYFDTGLSILLNKAKAGELGIGTLTSYDELTAQLAQDGSAGELIIAATEGRAPAQAVPQFFPEAQIQTYPTNEEAAAATLAGEAHLMVHDEVFLKVWQRDNRADTEFRTVVFDEPFKPDYYGFAVAKGNQEFLNLLDVFVRELRSDGAVLTALGQYIPVTTQVTTRSYNLSDDFYQGD